MTLVATIGMAVCMVLNAIVLAAALGHLTSLPSLAPAVMLHSMSEVTRILHAIDEGDPHAAEELLPLVYDELRKLAAHKLAQEQPGQTLQATALVHEAYLRLVDVDQGQQWNSRGHFFAAAAEAMRRILVEDARHKRSLKAGGDRRRLDLADLEPVATARDDELLALDEALDKLERQDPRKARLVKLRFFAGLTNEQAAGVLGISTSTADNDWAYARCWLRLEISGGSEAGQP
jgi:RNA polymerase sigma factor (TIGR02999 family)